MSKREVEEGSVMMMMMTGDKINEESLPWVEKYRPGNLQQVLAQHNVVSTIDRLMEANRLPHLLLYGPPGTGKTSTILACAKKMYGNKAKSMILELNASDDRGINVVRQQIKQFASTQQIFAQGCKLIILDEADSMTKAAQFALRRVIEKYTKNTRFCIICNYINKIIPALQSRCTRFRFSPLDSVLIANRLKQIAQHERIDVSDDGIKAVLALSNGDMRKCLNILQCTHMAFSSVNEENVYVCTGSPRPKVIETCFNLLLSGTFKQAFEGIRTIQIDEGLALTDIVTRIYTNVIHVPGLAPPAIAFAYTKLSDLEHSLSRETSEQTQLGSLVAIFQISRKITIDYFQTQSKK